MPSPEEPMRLSYSTLELLNLCERKLQLEKLLTAGETREESFHLSFGTAYGVGVQTYLETQDPELSLFKAWLAYYPVLEFGNKTVASCLLALRSSFPKLDDLLEDYELVYVEGKPACELSFRLNVNPSYYFVGYIDAVLRNRYTKKHYIFECKTTGLTIQDLSPLYKHSGQALGYSITLDKIVGKELSSYGVIYFVAQLQREFGQSTIHILPFEKTLMDRLNWFIVLGLDVKHLQEMEALQVFPRRGSSCLNFNKPCRHFGTCHLHSLDTPKAYEPDVTEYQFTYELDDLVADHIERVKNHVEPEPEPVKGLTLLSTTPVHQVAPSSKPPSIQELLAKRKGAASSNSKLGDTHVLC